MITLLLHLLRLFPFLFGSHRQLAVENLALRQQLAVYKRTTARPKLRTTDRLFWIWLARVWAGWRQPLVIVTADTVLRWQRRRFREYWSKLSGRSTGGRPAVHAEISGQSALGRSTNPWRVAQARPGRGRAHRLAITPEATLPAVADLANVSGQSCPRLGLDRFLHRAHRSAPRPVRLGRAPPPSAARRPLQRHRASHRRLDGPADRRCLSG